MVEGRGLGVWEYLKSSPMKRVRSSQEHRAAKGGNGGGLGFRDSVSGTRDHVSAFDVSTLSVSRHTLFHTQKVAWSEGGAPWY